MAEHSQQPRRKHPQSAGTTDSDHVGSDRSGGRKSGRREHGLKERVEGAVQNILDALRDLVAPEWVPVPIPVSNGRRRR